MTFLYNKTQSGFLCVLLHGAYNASVGLLILVPEARLEGKTYATMTLAITGAVLVVTAVLLLVTRGRLGLDAGMGVAPPAAQRMPR